MTTYGRQPMSIGTWLVRFRHVSADDYHTPAYRIPEQSIRVDAADAADAWVAVIRIFNGITGYLQKISIERIA